MVKGGRGRRREAILIELFTRWQAAFGENAFLVTGRRWARPGEAEVSDTVEGISDLGVAEVGDRV